jgi:hypothetical protein
LYKYWGFIGIVRINTGVTLVLLKTWSFILTPLSCFYVFPSQVAWADLDGDGFLDLVVSADDEDAPVVWFRQRPWLVRERGVGRETWRETVSVLANHQPFTTLCPSSGVFPRLGSDSTRKTTTEGRWRTKW